MALFRGSHCVYGKGGSCPERPHLPQNLGVGAGLSGHYTYAPNLPAQAASGRAPDRGAPPPQGLLLLTLPLLCLQKPSMFDVSRELGSSVSLYSRKVLIQTKATNILPAWLRFVRGLYLCPACG